MATTKTRDTERVKLRIKAGQPAPEAIEAVTQLTKAPLDREFGQQ